MHSNVNYRPNSGNIFSTEIFSICFNYLFENEGIEKGIISHLIDDYLLTPAKGGSSEKFSEWSDTTYLIHVLNGMVISGKLLEKYIEHNNLGSIPEKKIETETCIRLFFAAVSMHDADKLFNEGFVGAKNLDVVLKDHKQEIVKICSHYLRILGEPDRWWDDLSFIILRTENRTMELANFLNPTLDTSILATISEFAKLADETGGIKASNNEINTYLELKKYMKNINEEVNVFNFSSIPQTLLSEELKEQIRKELGHSKIIAETPNSIIYIGKSFEDSEILKIKRNFINKMEDIYDEKSIDQILNSYSPSGNSIRLGFANEISPTIIIVKKYIEKFNGKLLLYLSGKEIKDIYPDFHILAKKYGISLELSKIKPGFYLKIPEESNEIEDEPILKTRKIGLIACAKRTQYETDSNIFEEDLVSLFNPSLSLGILKDNNEVVKLSDVDLQLKKTIISIAYASKFNNSSLSDMSSEYEDILNSISTKLSDRYNSHKSLDFGKFFDIVNGKLEVTEDVPSKSLVCIQCGKFGNDPIKEENVFGYKATAGTGLKITTLKYDENKFNGRICGYCKKENLLRKEHIVGKIGSSLCVSVYVGDYVAPINVDSVMSHISNFKTQNESKSIGLFEDDNNSIVIRFGKSQRHIQYHTVLFIEKPKKSKMQSENDAEFWLLRNVLDLIIKTGLKIRISPLFSNLVGFKSMFKWENPPSWVSVLKFNEIRIDKISKVSNELDLMYKISRLSSQKSPLNFVIINATRGKRGLIYALWKNMTRSDNSSYILQENIIEKIEMYMEEHKEVVNKMKMDKIVEEACYIVTEGPKSANDHTWMIRQALDIYVRNIKKPNDEIKQIMAGRIWEIAKRSKYVRNETNEHSLNFSSDFVEMMRAEFKENIPTAEFKKDIIAQFAIMYNIEKWKQIKESKKDKEGEINE